MSVITSVMIAVGIKFKCYSTFFLLVLIRIPSAGAARLEGASPGWWIGDPSLEGAPDKIEEGAANQRSLREGHPDRKTTGPPSHGGWAGGQLPPPGKKKNKKLQKRRTSTRRWRKSVMK